VKRNSTALLAALNVLLVCLLAWLWIDPRGGLREVHWQPPAAIRPDLGGASGTIPRDDADVARFMVILDRPVFSPTRRPPPAKNAASARADPLDAIHLYGSFSGSEGGGVIVRVDGKTRRVKVSEAIGDWNLKEIRSGEVIFARGAETRAVPLVQAKQAAGAPLPAPPARPMLSTPVPLPAPAGVPVTPASVPSPAAAVGAPRPPAATPGPTPAPAGSKPSASPFVIGGSR